MVWAIQNLSGNSFSNYSTYFLTQAGLDSDSAYGFALGQYAMNCVGVFGACKQPFLRLLFSAVPSL